MGGASYTCNPDLTYQVEIRDADGVWAPKTAVRADEVFEFEVKPVNFKVNWGYRVNSYHTHWFGEREYSTNSSQPITLPCMGLGVSGGGGT